jgi:NAD(P)-dependent dehydrogenase (short-subunit alcohol dehydrogenase family)
VAAIIAAAAAEGAAGGGGGREFLVRCSAIEIYNEDIRDLLAPAEAAFGPVDVLVNNAGVQYLGAFTEFEVARGEQCLRVNLLAPLRLSHPAGPVHVASPVPRAHSRPSTR